MDVSASLDAKETGESGDGIRPYHRRLDVASHFCRRWRGASAP